MNQIDGVHALLIAVGGNRGHFRFGFYTDNISVDAEPTTPCNHFSDLARAKLGLKPQGLKAFNGGEMVQELTNRLTLSMLISKRRETREYVKYLQQAQPITEPTIEIDSLVKKLQRINIDGNTAVQLLLNLNRCALIEPSQFVRAALLDENNKIKPQLLISENKKLKRLNLNNLDITNLPVQECRTAVKNGTMLISEESYEKYYQLISSVESGENDKTQLPDNGDEKQ
ncbi:MAG: hypothetical protein MJ054_00065 [Clostridia bacterium]|nr:hypothetical protein [Clostridia bacterium]